MDPDLIMEELARSLTNKLIHHPSARLRKSSREHHAALLQAARELFNITTDPSAPDKSK